MKTTERCLDAELLRRFLGGSLSAAERTHVEDHVRSCPDCRRSASGTDGPPPSPGDSAGDTLTTLAGHLANDPPAGVAAGTVPARPAASGTVFSPGDALAGLKPGDRVDRYEILGVLGRGGMGVVFKARDAVLDRTVAIKTLGPFLADNARARERFIREGRTAAAVRDQHVVTVYGVEGHHGNPFLVLEYVEGKSLEEILAESAPLPVDEVVRLGVQIARGLAAAHRKGLIHRDVKPANVLVEDGTGRAALTDFGLARAVDDGSLSRAGEIFGTPHYMAPEQAAGSPVDHRADLFSLGSVLYYMATGRLPFNAPTAMSVVHRVYHDQPAPVRECNPSVPPWLGALIASLHDKDPGRRPPSADAVGEALLAGEAADPTERIGPARAPVNRTQRGRVVPRAVFAAALGLVFLVSLPAFYLMTRPAGDPVSEYPRGVASADSGKKPEVPPEAAKEPKPAPPTRAAVVPRVTGAPGRRAPRAEPTLAPAGKPDAAAPRPATGVVTLLANDPSCVAFFRAEGVSVRNARTAELLALDLGRNSLPAGDYDLLSADPAPGIRLSPRHFRLSGEQRVTLTISRAPLDGPPPGLPGFVPPPPPEPMSPERPRQQPRR